MWHNVTVKVSDAFSLWSTFTVSCLDQGPGIWRQECFTFRMWFGTGWNTLEPQKFHGGSSVSGPTCWVTGRRCEFRLGFVYRRFARKPNRLSFRGLRCHLVYQLPLLFIVSVGPASAHRSGHGSMAGHLTPGSILSVAGLAPAVTTRYAAYARYSRLLTMTTLRL